MDKRLAECQRVIGHHFANPGLLEIALTHSSLRTPDRECNERLEFLGDSVLGLVITEELYKLLPDQAEGELTRIKSAVVSRGALYRASTELGLARFALFARGVGRRNELPVSVIANLVESVIGAVYLDAGFFPAREFVIRHLGPELDDVLADRGAKNYKSLLQHAVQESAGVTPTYRTVEEEGPQHRKVFTVAAVIRSREWGRASGATKKDAEQEAARRALEAWTRRGRGRRRRRGGDEPEGRAAGRSEPAPEPAAAGAATADVAPARSEGPGRRRRRRGGRSGAEAPARAADAAPPRHEAAESAAASAAPELVPDGTPTAAGEASGTRSRRRRSRAARAPAPAEGLRTASAAPEAADDDPPRRRRRRQEGPPAGSPEPARDAAAGAGAGDGEVAPRPPGPPPAAPEAPTRPPRGGFAEGLDVPAVRERPAGRARSRPDPDLTLEAPARRKAPRREPRDEPEGFAEGL